MLKIGSDVFTVRACGALCRRGTVDLPAGATGKVVALSLSGEYAKVELAEAPQGAGGSLVYLASGYIADLGDNA